MLLENKNIFPQLNNICPGRVKTNQSLKNYSRWRIGGLCAYVVEPRTKDEVSSLILFLRQNSISYLVVGDGSNILFDSSGLNAVLIKIGQRMAGIEISGHEVMVDAGIWVPRFARCMGLSGFTGMEHTIGIPGTLGGLICMNGGSQRKGIGENVLEVTAVMPSGEVKTFSKTECDFSYRSSVFQRNQAVILQASLSFERGSYRNVRKEMLAIMRSRRERFPLKLPNCGSVFVSDPAMYSKVGPPGKVIEELGLKGYVIGGAQISDAHANFIVNRSDASSEDVLSLIYLIRSKAFQKTGYLMDCEVRHISYDNTSRMAHEYAEILFNKRE